MKRRVVAVTLSLIMTMATVSEAGAAAFTSPDTAPAVATQTDAEEVNVTEETSETDGEDFSVKTYFDKIDECIVFKWNRVYPADQHLDIDISKMTKVQEEEFVGFSHEKITMEVYER